MHVTDVEDGETVEEGRQLRGNHVVMPEANALGVPPPAPVEAAKHQRAPNKPMKRVPDLYVKEVDSLAEALRLVVRLWPQPPPGVPPPETLLQLLQDFLVHESLILIA